MELPARLPARRPSRCPQNTFVPGRALTGCFRVDRRQGFVGFLLTQPNFTFNIWTQVQLALRI